MSPPGRERGARPKDAPTNPTPAPNPDQGREATLIVGRGVVIEERSAGEPRKNFDEALRRRWLAAQSMPPLPGHHPRCQSAYDPDLACQCRAIRRRLAQLDREAQR